MEILKKYFSMPAIFTAFAVVFVLALGLYQSGFDLALTYLVSTLLLGLLEVSVSLDNAVVNAKVMGNMNERSKSWFVSWGMLIAVFGMRVLFPVLIVCIAAWTDPISAVKMALFSPSDYRTAVESAHIEVMGFGAAFLLMVFLEFFFNSEKENHWIPGLENLAAYIGKFPQVQLIIAIPLIILASLTVPHEGKELLLSGFGGMVTWYIVGGIKEILESDEAHPTSTLAGVGQLMIGTLIYLEILDASFSLDGVIAAFAITNNFIIIGLGLGIGAFFVRALTMYMSDMGMMEELTYLEHGAFWGIGWLVAVMTLSVYGFEVGEFLAAGVAAAFIIFAGIHSLIQKNENTPINLG